MGVTIEIDPPHLLPHLLDRLEEGGCSAELIDGRVARVVHNDALDPDEAFRELRFFVRAWAGGRGDVTVVLQPDV